jgi:hypothetical protein
VWTEICAMCVARVGKIVILADTFAKPLHTPGRLPRGRSIRR